MEITVEEGEGLEVLGGNSWRGGRETQVGLV